MMKSALPLVAPFFLFMAFLMVVDGRFPDQHYALYPFKTILVALAIAWFWRSLPSLKPGATLLSAGVGVIAGVLWVGLDPWAMQIDIFLEKLFNRFVSAVGLGSWRTPVDGVPVGRNPFQLYPSALAWTLFGFRVAGIALCVPVMEELFWRGFLMRWLIREDFTTVPIGTYQPFSFYATTALFTMEHGAEWPQAVVVGLIYGVWFVRTRKLGDVMVAHGVTNLLLALYCLGSSDWHFLSTVAPAHR